MFLLCSGAHILVLLQQVFTMIYYNFGCVRLGISHGLFDVDCMLRLACGVGEFYWCT
jgi:hypothetical protein